MNKFGLVLAQIFKFIKCSFLLFCIYEEKIDALRATAKKITLKEPRK